MNIHEKGVGELYKSHATLVKEALDAHITDKSLHESMTRWKNTLFYHDFSSQFRDYFRRVNAFDGYNPGDHNAFGFKNDTVGQLYGTVGQLQFYLRTARNEGRSINSSEVQTVENNFLKAAQFRGNSAKMLASSDHSRYLSDIHIKEQTQIELLARSVTKIIEVIEILDHQDTTLQQGQP